MLLHYNFHYLLQALDVDDTGFLSLGLAGIYELTILPYAILTDIPSHNYSKRLRGKNINYMFVASGILDVNEISHIQPKGPQT